MFSVSTIQSILFILILATLIGTVIYSFRYRRHHDPKMRGLLAARMNICMGTMLIFIAITQLFIFHDTAFRRFFGTVCLLMGLFNLFAGIRNHRLYSKNS